MCNLKKQTLNLKNILLIFIIISIFSCASYSKKEFKKNYTKIDDNGLNKINGNFQFYPSKRFGKDFEDRNPDSLRRYVNLYQGLIDEERENRIRFDSLRNDKKHYSVNLNLKNKTELNIKVLEDSKILKDTIIYGKLKKGMFYLDNKDLKINGVPFLFGGYQSDKRRIGISTNNNLIINTAIGNEGGLLIIFSAGYQYNTSYEFERIK